MKRLAQLVERVGELPARDRVALGWWAWVLILAPGAVAMSSHYATWLRAAAVPLYALGLLALAAIRPLDALITDARESRR